MAVVVIQSANTRIQDFEGAATGVIGISSTGATADLPILLNDFVLQGSASWGHRMRKANEDHGWGYTPLVTTDMRLPANRAWMVKVMILTVGQLNPRGIRVRAGSATTAYYDYMLRDGGQAGTNELSYPVRGGWLVEAVDPNLRAWRDGTTGSPLLAQVDFFAVTADVANVSDGENLFMDAIDIGIGLWGYGGTGADPFLVVDDFVSFDEGTSLNRFGHASQNEGVVQVIGKLTIGENNTGAARPARWRDGNFSMVFPGGRVSAGFNGIRISMADAATVVVLSNASMSGNGRSAIQRTFSTASEVSSITNQISSPSDHGFFDGDAVIYDKNGGSANMGLTDGIMYFVNKVSDTAYTIHNSRADGFSGTSPVNLTASFAASSESHILVRDPDTRPVFIVDGSAGSSSQLNRVSFQDFSDITVNAKQSFQDCTFFNCNSLTLGTTGDVGSMDGCTIIKHTTHQGDSFVKSADPSKISNCEFNFKTAVDTAFGSGHAIEALDTGTYAFVGNTFIGYGPNEALFDANKDVISNTIAVEQAFVTAISDGHAVYYETGSANLVGGLVAGARYYASIVSSTTISLHRTQADAVANTQAIVLSAGAVLENHYIASATAALVNKTTGTVTIDVSGDVPPPTVRTVRSGGSPTETVVNVSVPISVHVQALSDLSDVVGARVLLEAAAGGQLPAGDSVTITASGSTATVTHLSHGLLVNDRVMIRGADQAGYNGDATIFSVPTIDTYSYTVPLGTPATATGSVTSTSIILNGVTDASGLITGSFAYKSDQPVSGRIRSSTTSPLYQTAAIPGTITLQGFDATNLLVSDE